MPKSVNNHHQVFETFKIDEKIKELKALLNCQDLSVFDGQHIVVAVPSFDESVRHIEKYDPELFACQQADAYHLADFIIFNTKADAVSVLMDSNEADELVDSITKPITYVILLHEFIPSEKSYLTESLRENRKGDMNKNLQMIALY